jgi:hypothetical protein
MPVQPDVRRAGGSPSEGPGWQLNGNLTWQLGASLGFVNVIFTGDIKDISLSSGERYADRWFNTEAGFNELVTSSSARIPNFPTALQQYPRATHRPGGTSRC